MTLDDLREVVHAAQNHVPVNPLKMQSGFVVDEADDHAVVEAAGIVEAPFFEKELATSAGSVENDPFDVTVKVGVGFEEGDDFLHAAVKDTGEDHGSMSEGGDYQSAPQTDGRGGGID